MLKVMCGNALCKHNASRRRGVAGECTYDGEVTLKYVNNEDEVLRWAETEEEADDLSLEGLSCSQYEAAGYEKFE